METATYTYESTLNNFIPFTIGYQTLSSTFKDSVTLLSEFNLMFKNSLMDIIKHSVHMQIPTLQNLYEQVIFLLKDTLTKTMTIQNIFERASLEMNSNSFKLKNIYNEHLDSLKDNSNLFEQMKLQLKMLKQSTNSINQQILLITEADTIEQYYKQIYRQKHIVNGKKRVQLETQLNMISARTQCLQTNIKMELEKNIRLFSVLSNELQEVMVSTTLIQFNTKQPPHLYKTKTISYHTDRISTSLEEMCISVQQLSQEQRTMYTTAIDNDKRRIEQWLSSFEIDQ